ncbi:MAG: arsenical pump-driving ATPase GET3, partial [Brevibacterium sp.]|nr:arsenical pump-driving ATPase GET3 [Brevibacterium sp.]
RDLHVDLAGVVVNRRSPANAGDLLAARRDLEDRQLAELTRGVAPVPVSEVPLLAGELTGPEAVRQLADLLV